MTTFMTARIMIAMPPSSASGWALGAHIEEEEGVRVFSFPAMSILSLGIFLLLMGLVIWGPEDRIGFLG